MRHNLTLLPALLLCTFFFLNGCATVQDVLDQQSKALPGIVPNASSSIQSWNVNGAVVHLQKTAVSHKYRLASRSFERDQDLVISEISNIQKFDLPGQTVFVFTGSYGANKEMGYDVISLGNKLHHSFVPAETNNFVFQPSVDGKNIIGIPARFNTESSVFLSKPHNHYWPMRFSRLPSNDRKKFLSQTSSSKPTQKKPETSGPIYSKSITKSSSEVQSASTPTPATKQSQKPATGLIKRTNYEPLPEATTGANQSNDTEKPVLRID